MNMNRFKTMFLTVSFLTMCAASRDANAATIYGAGMGRPATQSEASYFLVYNNFVEQLTVGTCRYWNVSIPSCNGGCVINVGQAANWRLFLGGGTRVFSMLDDGSVYAANARTQDDLLGTISVYGSAAVQSWLCKEASGSDRINHFVLN